MSAGVPAQSASDSTLVTPESDAPPHHSEPAVTQSSAAIGGTGTGVREHLGPAAAKAVQLLAQDPYPPLGFPEGLGEGLATTRPK